MSRAELASVDNCGRSLLLKRLGVFPGRFLFTSKGKSKTGASMEGSPDAQTLASGRPALKSGPPAEHEDRLVEAAGVVLFHSPWNV